MRWGDTVTRICAVTVGLACLWTALLGAPATVQAERNDSPALTDDPFFAGNWVVSPPIGGTESRRGVQVAVDSQERVIIASQARDRSTSWTCEGNRGADTSRHPYQTSAVSAYLERFLPNGELDTTFGKQGLVTIPQFAQTQAIRSIGVMRDASIVVVMEGETTGCLPHLRVGRDIALRITARGDWDSTWVPQGRLLTDLFGVFALGIERDRVLLVDDGTLHQWSSGTWTQHPLPDHATAQSIAVNSQWVAMDDVRQEVDSEGRPLERTTANGWLIANDSSLHDAPKRIRIPLGLPELHVPARSLLAWDGEGRLIAVTSAFELDKPPAEGWSIRRAYFIVSRLIVDVSGSVRLDPAFADGGRLVFQPPPDHGSEPNSFAFQVSATPGQGVLVLGMGPVTDFGYVNFALRLTEDGEPDATFGRGGIAVLPNEAIMEGPAAVDRQGRWFGAAQASILTSEGLRKKPRGPAAVRVAPSGAITASNGSGWRPIVISPKRPSRISVVSIAGCDVTGERKVTATVRVAGQSGKRWIPLAGATVDMTIPHPDGYDTVIARQKTDRSGRVRLEGTISGSEQVGFFLGATNTHHSTQAHRMCGASRSG